MSRSNTGVCNDLIESSTKKENSSSTFLLSVTNNDNIQRYMSSTLSLSGVKKKKVTRRGIKEKREHVDIKQDKLCTSVSDPSNNASKISISNTSDAIRDNIVQPENLVVSDFNTWLLFVRDTSGGKLMQLGGSQIHHQAKDDPEEDDPMQQDSGQKPDQAIVDHEDDAVQQYSDQKPGQAIDDPEEDDPMKQDSGQKPDQAIVDHEDDAVQQDSDQTPGQAIDDPEEDDPMQQDSGQKPDQAIDDHENDPVQQDSGQKPGQAIDDYEDDQVQQDSGQKPSQAIDDHADDAVQQGSDQKPGLAIDDHEDDPMQQYSGQKPDQAIDANEDNAMQEDNDPSPNEATEEMIQKDTWIPIETQRTLNEVLADADYESDYSIMDLDEKSPNTVCIDWYQIDANNQPDRQQP